VKIEFQEPPPDRKGVIKLKVTFEKYDIHPTETLFGTILYVKGCGIKGPIGGPGLPSQVIKIALPPLTTNVIVSAEQVGKKVSLKRNGDLIAPVQLSMINANYYDDSSPDYKGGMVNERERFKLLNHQLRDKQTHGN
jgi:hypothetical protein